MAKAQTIIKKFMKVLDTTTSKGTTALDEAVKAVSNFQSWSQLKKTMINDCASYNGNGKGFLKTMCGIVLGNSDTGAIIGKDAGGSTIKNAAGIVPESGSWKYPSSTSFKIQGLTVTVPKKNTLSAEEKFIVGSLYTWWIKSALNLIKTSYGLTFQEKGTTVKSIDVSFYNRADGAAAYVTHGSSKKTSKLTMKINMYYLSDINKKNSNGVASKLLTYFDRTIAHEMVHAVMAANVDYFNSLPFSFREGVAELVHGIDDKRRANIETVASSSSALSSALSGSKVNSYAAGYIALRYLAKQASKNRKPSSNVVSSKNDLWGDSTSSDVLNGENNFAANDSLSKILPAENLTADDFSLSSQNNSNLIQLASSHSLEKNNA